MTLQIIGFTFFAKIMRGSLTLEATINKAVISFERGFNVNFGEAIINLNPTGFLCI